MTKAFWTIVPAVFADNQWEPDLPSLSSIQTINPLELWVLPEGAGGAAGHRHLFIGSIGLPSYNVASKHSHFFIRHTDEAGNVLFTYHRLIHESDAQHQHPDPVLAFFMPWIVCSDADFTTLTSAPYNVRAIAQATITTVDGQEVIGNLESTAWSGAQRTAWANAALTNLGIALPVEVDRGARLVAFLMKLGIARVNMHERALRG